MHTPLYQELHSTPPQSGQTHHLGLWFERFFSAFSPDFSNVDKNFRSKWLEHFNNQKAGQEAPLREKASAIEQLAHSRGGQTRIYHCPGNFVTGTGNPHPLENGFLWHPTLGTPYLPGSAVKGLIRSLVETAYHGSDKHEVLEYWFGTVKKDEVAEKSGSFIFLDALPVAPCKIAIEIMTPHMGKWYENGGKNPLSKDTQPGDWHTPVPVGYLVAQDLKLQFAILPRPGISREDAANILENLWLALDNALNWMGAGAKTAIGFGQMHPDQDAIQQRVLARQKAEEEELRKTLTPARLAINDFIAELRNKHEAYPNYRESPNANFHNKARALARIATDDPDWSSDEKHDAAEAIETWLPKLVKIDIKEERKKLKLNALKAP